MSKDLKDKTLAELQQLVVGLGQKKYVAGYLFGFIHTKGAGAISEITPLSKAFRGKLADEGYFISGLNTLDCLTDPDGSAKFLFELGDDEVSQAEFFSTIRVGDLVDVNGVQVSDRAILADQVELEDEEIDD